MTRLLGIFLLGCVALPVLIAQEPEVDQLGKDMIRLLNKAADDLEAVLKDLPKEPAEVKAVEDKIAKFESAMAELVKKKEMLSPEKQKEFVEKHGKELKAAVDRFKAIEEKIKGPAGEQESPQAIAERIEKNNEEAVKRLNMKDPISANPNAGKETIKLQDDIIKDLKKLLEQNDPNGGGGGAQGQGNQGGGQGKQGGGQGKEGGGQGKEGGGQGKEGGGQGKEGGGQGKEGGGQGKEGGGQGKEGGGQGKEGGGQGKEGGGQGKEGGGQGKEGGGQGKEGGGKGGKDGKGGSGMGGKGQDGKLNNPDIKFEEWGKMPAKQRVEMETYAKEAFMRRYEEQLRKYYRAIAEESRKD